MRYSVLVQNKSRTFKASVLSLSLLTIMSGAGVAPGIYKIADAFPDASETVIKLIISFPPLFMIIAALLSGVMGQFVKHKTLIISGLVIFIIGGVGAGYMNTIPQILLFRAILGIGTGLILPFSTGLIAACFDGDLKTKMMGYSSAVNSLGAIIGNIFAGLLAVIGWRYMFHIYWMGALVLLVVILFLNQLPETENNQEVKDKLSGRVYLYSFYAFLTMMVFYLIVTNLSFFVEARQLGSAKITGLLFATSSLTMFFGGVLMSYLLALRRFFLPFVLVFISFGLYGIAKSTGLVVLFISIVSAGWGLGLLFPYLLNSISGHVPKASSLKAMSIGMASAWLGQFVSPLVFGEIARIFDISMVSVFINLSGIILLVIGIVLIINPGKE